MTVSMCFLMGALKLEWPDCMNGMMYYSFLLIGGNEVYRRKSGLQGSMNAPADRFIDEFMGEFGLFAALQFWIISGMMAYKAVAGGIGFIIGILFLGIWEVTFWDTLAFADGSRDRPCGAAAQEPGNEDASQSDHDDFLSVCRLLYPRGFYISGIFWGSHDRGMVSG